MSYLDAFARQYLPQAITREQLWKNELRESSLTIGRFDYSINLAEHAHDISILTAPNGYGKSTILKIISSFASGDHYYFIREKFGSIRFFLSDNEVVEVIHIDDDHENNQVTICSGL